MKMLSVDEIWGCFLPLRSEALVFLSPTQNHRYTKTQAYPRVTQPIPDTCSVCPKLIYTEMRKQKNLLYEVLEMSNAFSDECFTLHSFPHICATQLRVSVSWKWFARRDVVNLFGTGEPEKVSLDSFWQVN
jgi:hypothetical protein